MELDAMPNHYVHTIYKQYVETVMDETKREAHQTTQIEEELQDQMT